MSYSTLYSRLTWADLSPTPPESPIVSSELSSHITRTNKAIDGRPRFIYRRYLASSDTMYFGITLHNILCAKNDIENVL